MTARAEVVVCGAGHNSLVAAAYLAKAGLQVLVLEKNADVGGGVVSREIPGAPGFVSNPHAQGVLLMASNPIITRDELGLRSKFGLELVEWDSMYSTQFEDGQYLTQFTSVDRVCQGIARYSAKDADAYRRYAERSLKLLPLLSQGLFVPPTPMGALFMMLDQSREGRFVLSELMNSAYNIIDGLFEHERVKLHFMHYVAELMVAPEQYGTGLVPYLLTGLIHSSKPFNIKGGSGRFTAALKACVESLGGTVRFGARVRQVTSRGGRAKGVVLDTGETIEATKAVLACIHPHDLGAMVEGVDPFVARQATKVQLSNFGAFNTHVALREPPKYLGGAEVDNAMMVECVPTDLMAFRRSFDELRYGRLPDYHNYNVAVFGPRDASMVPQPGQASLYLYKFAPLMLADGGNAGWARIKEATAERFVRNYQRYAPNVDESTILARYSETPQEMYAHNPLFKNGDIFGIGTFLNQFLSYRPTPELGQYAVPGVDGLYLAGPVLHPGGGVTGGGRAPAIRILTDLGVPLAPHFQI
ncbi:MAG TPA: NAD(P)/FAD-dependent oxidoreductase [Nevskiaceae bacterium]|nr:NAD(P)/FAD-dependent oxidoreductase [Nevskiaceae bacterium]